MDQLWCASVEEHARRSRGCSHHANRRVRRGSVAGIAARRQYRKIWTVSVLLAGRDVERAEIAALLDAARARTGRCTGDAGRGRVGQVGAADGV
jgi:hypothetical protein